MAALYLCRKDSSSFPIVTPGLMPGWSVCEIPAHTVSVRSAVVVRIAVVVHIAEVGCTSGDAL